MKKTTLMVRGLRINVQEWGDSRKPTLMCLHGWMDCGATYQYMANYLADSFHLVAPDLRGFGESEHAPSYWFPDYFADLAVVLNSYSENAPVNLVGHSMGGNIAAMYAGIEPHRVGKLLILEALGMPATQPDQAPQKYRRWMNEILSDEPTKIYPSLAILKSSIRKGNPSLSEDMIDDLSELWAKPFGDQGAMVLKHDHKHRYANPVRYNFDDVLEVWKLVTAKVGLVMAEESSHHKHYLKSGRTAQAKEVLGIAEANYWQVADAGHMLHIEQPEKTAACVAAFFE